MSAFYNVDQPPFNVSSAARAIAAANNGLLFDIGDMSTLYQDAAGTVPVTAVRQPVGKILDKSGNDYHATQSITASRPTLIYENGMYGLRFDGIDDYLNLPYMGLYAGGSASVIALTNLHTTTYHEYLLTERSTVATSPAYLLQRKSSSSARIGDFIRNDAGEIFVDNNSIPIVQANTVLLSTVDSGTSINTYINGVVGSSIGYTRAGTLTPSNTVIGTSVSTTTGNYASMKLHGLIITKSALTDAQRVRCERFLARKAGVML